MDFWLSVALFVVTGLLGFFGGKLQKQIRKEMGEDRAIKNGMLALLRTHIIEIWDKCTERGFVHIHTMESVDEMYKQYHELGGNGTVTKLVEDLKKLDVR